VPNPRWTKANHSVPACRPRVRWPCGRWPIGLQSANPPKAHGFNPKGLGTANKRKQRTFLMAHDTRANVSPFRTSLAGDILNGLSTTMNGPSSMCRRFGMRTPVIVFTNAPTMQTHPPCKRTHHANGPTRQTGPRYNQTTIQPESSRGSGCLGT